LKKIFQNFAIAGVLVSAPLYPSIVDSPKDLSNWYEKSFTYQREALNEDGSRQDIWKTPKETVDDRGGDCEDFAILSKKILKELGYEAWMLAMYDETNVGHAVCLFREIDGTYSIMDVRHYVPFKRKDFNTIFKTNYKEYDHFSICTEDELCDEI